MPSLKRGGRGHTHQNLTKNGQPLQQHCNGIQSKPGLLLPNPIERFSAPPSTAARWHFRPCNWSQPNVQSKSPKSSNHPKNSYINTTKQAAVDEPHHQRLPQPVSLAITNPQSQVRSASAKRPGQNLGTG
jgi:hypothetical protein